MYKVSVVVPAYNEERLIKRCLKSLNEQTFCRDDYEIIVVDNCSTDETAQIAIEYADQVLYESKKGLIHARKKGFNEATGEIILRTDADAFVSKSWIEHAVRIFDEHKDIDVITGNYIHVDDESHQIVSSLYKIQNTTREIGFELTNKIFWLAGSCSGFRRSFYHRIGGFDEELDPVLADQIEIAYRANKYGNIYYDPNWNSFMSNRRDKIKNHDRLVDFINDALIYRFGNIVLFLIFKKQVFKKLGIGWKDIRQN